MIMAITATICCCDEFISDLAYSSYLVDMTESILRRYRVAIPNCITKGRCIHTYTRHLCAFLRGVIGYPRELIRDDTVQSVPRSTYIRYIRHDRLTHVHERASSAGPFSPYSVPLTTCDKSSRTFVKMGINSGSKPIELKVRLLEAMVLRKLKVVETLHLDRRGISSVTILDPAPENAIALNGVDA